MEATFKEDSENCDLEEKTRDLQVSSWNRNQDAATQQGFTKLLGRRLLTQCPQHSIHLVLGLQDGWEGPIIGTLRPEIGGREGCGFVIGVLKVLLLQRFPGCWLMGVVWPAVSTQPRRVLNETQHRIVNLKLSGDSFFLVVFPWVTGLCHSQV